MATFSRPDVISSNYANTVRYLKLKSYPVANLDALEVLTVEFPPSDDTWLLVDGFGVFMATWPSTLRRLQLSRKLYLHCTFSFLRSPTTIAFPCINFNTFQLYLYTYHQLSFPLFTDHIQLSTNFLCIHFSELGDAKSTSKTFLSPSPSSLPLSLFPSPSHHSLKIKNKPCVTLNVVLPM